MKAMAASWVGVMMLLATMVICSGGGAHAAGRSLLQTRCPNPALPDVNLSAYLGVWYEIASTAIFKSTTEAFLECVTARYSLLPDGKTIRVRNEGYNQTSGEFVNAIGTAAVTGRTLRVSFSSGPPGDYRIIYIKGDAEDRYETAVVYSCDQEESGITQGIFILSRKPTLDSDESVSGITEFVRRQGITLEPTNQLVLTDQSAITCGRNFS